MLIHFSQLKENSVEELRGHVTELTGSEYMNMHGVLLASM